MQPTQLAAVQVAANNTVTRRLGNWTDASRFEVRAHRGKAVVDLRSPRIPAGVVEVAVDLDHAALTLLVADNAIIDDRNLLREGRGQVRDAQRPAGQDPDGPRMVITGNLRQSEIRVRRGGVAIVSAMLSREYLADLRRAHRAGRLPTVDDPTRTA
jgi:hypothetical protein